MATSDHTKVLTLNGLKEVLFRMREEMDHRHNMAKQYTDSQIKAVEFRINNRTDEVIDDLTAAFEEASDGKINRIQAGLKSKVSTSDFSKFFIILIGLMALVVIACYLMTGWISADIKELEASMAQTEERLNEMEETVTNSIASIYDQMDRLEDELNGVAEDAAVIEEAIDAESSGDAE